MTSAFLPGFFLSLSLILAIGAQNAFVLRQGLRQEHVFAVCLVCAVSDAILIAAGVAGFGLASHALPWLEPVLRYGGALFLLAYAARSLRSALRNHGSLTPSGRQAAGLGATLATCGLHGSIPMSISTRWCCSVRSPASTTDTRLPSRWAR